MKTPGHEFDMQFSRLMDSTTGTNKSNVIGINNFNLDVSITVMCTGWFMSQFSNMFKKILNCKIEKIKYYKEQSLAIKLKRSYQ